MSSASCDAIIIGGGYFGCRIALHLRMLGIRVVVVEAESSIMRRASYGNQARIHGGYHYPRDLHTGLASQINYGRFVNEHAYAVDRSTDKLYALARGSFVSPGQFERFCKRIRAPLRPLPPSFRSLFDFSLVEEAYLVEETAFNARAIADHLEKEIEANDIQLVLNTKARYIGMSDDGLVEVELGDRRQHVHLLVNCSYANLDGVGIPISTPLRKEWAELALLTPPPQLGEVSVTIMDGPFFSFMPFPALSQHTLSHVRYTPINAWLNPLDKPGFPEVSGVGPSRNGESMLRDAARYIPKLQRSRLGKSIFEIKTVLSSNDRNDGRPILLERAKDAPGVVSILGGKIDNIYDALEFLNETLVGEIIQ